MAASWRQSNPQASANKNRLRKLAADPRIATRLRTWFLFWLWLIGNARMAERKPFGMPFETWIDRAVREAQERGDFDDLPQGKPIPNLGRLMLRK